METSNIKNKPQKNVLGTDLQLCGCYPNSGFFRDGFCNTSSQDLGLHIICAIMTDKFLAFSHSNKIMIYLLLILNINSWASKKVIDGVYVLVGGLKQ